MTDLIIYNFKAAAIISLFYMVYLIFLKRESYFRANRIYLMLSIAIAYIIPLIELKPSVSQDIASIQLEPILVNSISNTSIENISSKMDVLGMVFIGVAAFFLLRFIFLLIKIVKIIVRRPKQKIKGYTFVFIPDNHSPFSFFRYVFIPKEKMHAYGSRELLSHEFAHVRMFHSFDKVVFELLSLVQWFNPFYWLLKKELDAIHEFEADNAAIKTEKQRFVYKKVLVENHLGLIPIEIANYFNYSLIKKRIRMITQNKSSKWASIKYALILPACIMSILVFSNFQQELMAQTNTEEEVYTVVEKVPEYPGGQEAMFAFISENVSYPAIAQKNGVSGTAYVNFVVTSEGKVTKVGVMKNTYTYDDIDKNTSLSADEKSSLKIKCERALNSEAIKVVSSMPNWTPGEEKGKPVAVSFNLPIKFALSSK